MRALEQRRQHSGPHHRSQGAGTEARRPLLQGEGHHREERRSRIFRKPDALRGDVQAGAKHNAAYRGANGVLFDRRTVPLPGRLREELRARGADARDGAADSSMDRYPCERGYCRDQDARQGREQVRQAVQGLRRRMYDRQRREAPQGPLNVRPFRCMGHRAALLREAFRPRGDHAPAVCGQERRVGDEIFP